MATHDSTAATGGDSLPLPNNLHSASGSGPGAGPRLINMANGLKKRFSRDPAAPSQAGSASHGSNWWKIHLFRGMINDVRRRAPYYWSDWVDAWDYRVIPATVYMYFAKYDYPHHQNFPHRAAGYIIYIPFHYKEVALVQHVLQAGSRRFLSP